MKKTNKKTEQSEPNNHEDLHSFFRGTDVDTKAGEKHSFHVTSFHYIVSASKNPNQHAQTIQLSGPSGGETVGAYLIFSDELKTQPPRYQPTHKMIYINYPESYLVTVEQMLQSNKLVLCQMLSFPETNHVWASVEAAG